MALRVDCERKNAELAEIKSKVATYSKDLMTKNTENLDLNSSLGMKKKSSQNTKSN